MNKLLDFQFSNEKAEYFNVLINCDICETELYECQLTAIKIEICEKKIETFELLLCEECFKEFKQKYLLL